MKNLKLYYINEDYIDYLRKYDNKVSYNKDNSRPYIGIVFVFNGFNYFAPLASPKPKHLKISNKAVDIFKIQSGKLGVVNINNMLPTPMKCVNELMPLIKDEKYKKLLENQLTYLNNHKMKLFAKINTFQKQYRNNFLDYKVKNRSCNFELLEDKCSKYQKSNN